MTSFIRQKGRAGGVLKRGSTLVAALVLAFLIFVVSATALLRAGGEYTRVTGRYLQSSALFVAEGGLRYAASRLVRDRSYAGEKNIDLPTGRFDVSVTPENDAFIVVSTGRSMLGKMSGRKTVRAAVHIYPDGSFGIEDWREDP